jgi:phospholipase/carboxylesterase
MRTLKSDSRAAQSGKATSLVVFLHGYGADGGDLLGLADALAPHLPDTGFAAPDAPEPCRGGYGRQWFPIPWLDGSSEVAAAIGLAAATDDLNGYLDAQLAAHALSADRLCVLGFSQGAMMAMHVVPRRPAAVAGVVAISGRLLVPERLGEVVSKPPVLLIHGDDDQVVPFADMGTAGRALVAAGFETFGHVMHGTGHGIAPDGLQVALSFMAERLGY